MGAVRIDIVIPSHLRAGRVKTLGAVSKARICVPESQKEDYGRHNQGVEIIAHPDSIKGLALKRQWIYEKFPNVLMIDDDILSLQRLYTESGEETKCTPEEAYDIFQWIGNVAKMMGCYLFSVNKNGSPAQYMELKPLRRTGYVGGTIGLLEGSKLFFDKQAVVVEDYWISALNAFHHRHCFIDTRFAVVGEKTFGNKGGCSAYRTLEQEKKDTLWLRSQFGEVIKLKEDTALAKRKHEYQRTLVLPF